MVIALSAEEQNVIINSECEEDALGAHYDTIDPSVGPYMYSNALKHLQPDNIKSMAQTIIDKRHEVEAAVTTFKKQRGY